MKITSFEKGVGEDKEVVYVDDVEIQYCQPPDDNIDNDEVQVLTVKSVNYGGGRYLAISTPIWSFEKINDLIAVLKDFKKRALIDDNK